MPKFKKDLDSVPPPPTSRTLPRDEAKKAILGLAKRASRPLLIGAVAIHLGYFWSVARTEELFQELVSEGQLRLISQDERTAYGLEEGYLLALAR